MAGLPIESWEISNLMAIELRCISLMVKKRSKLNNPDK
jgi:hypothetical protein